MLKMSKKFRNLYPYSIYVLNQVRTLFDILLERSPHPALVLQDQSRSSSAQSLQETVHFFLSGEGDQEVHKSV